MSNRFFHFGILYVEVRTMEIFYQAAQNPETQLLIPLLLVIVPMLRSIPNLPKWSNQWIILTLAVILSIIMSGFNFNAISNGFLASMAVTYVSVGVTRRKDEQDKMKNESVIANLYHHFFSNRDDIPTDEICEEIVKEVLKQLNTAQLDTLANNNSSDGQSSPKEETIEVALKTLSEALHQSNNPTIQEALQTISNALHGADSSASIEEAIQTLSEALHQSNNPTINEALQTVLEVFYYANQTSKENALQVVKNALQHTKYTTHRDDVPIEKPKALMSRFKRPQKQSKIPPQLLENEEEFYNQLVLQIYKQILTDYKLCPHCQEELAHDLKKRIDETKNFKTK